MLVNENDHVRNISIVRNDTSMMDTMTVSYDDDRNMTLSYLILCGFMKTTLQHICSMNGIPVIRGNKKDIIDKITNHGITWEQLGTYQLDELINYHSLSTNIPTTLHRDRKISMLIRQLDVSNDRSDNRLSKIRDCMVRFLHSFNTSKDHLYSSTNRVYSSITCTVHINSQVRSAHGSSSVLHLLSELQIGVSMFVEDGTTHIRIFHDMDSNDKTKRDDHMYVEINGTFVYRRLENTSIPFLLQARCMNTMDNWYITHLHITDDTIV